MAEKQYIRVDSDGYVILSTNYDFKNKYMNKGILYNLNQKRFYFMEYDEYTHNHIVLNIKSELDVLSIYKEKFDYSNKKIDEYFNTILKLKEMMNG